MGQDGFIIRNRSVLCFSLARQLSIPPAVILGHNYPPVARPGALPKRRIIRDFLFNRGEGQNNNNITSLFVVVQGKLLLSNGPFTLYFYYPFINF